MRIVFLTRYLGFGGAERQLVLLARGLAARGHVVVVAPFYDGGPLQPELGQAVRVVPLGKKGRWDLVGFFLRLLKMIRAERPDVLHSYLVVPNILAALAGRIAGRTGVVWGIRASQLDFSRYPLAVGLAFRLQSLLSRIPALVIFNSVAGRDWHNRSGLRPRRQIVIPNGIDTDRFQLHLERRKEVRRQWSVDDREILIGTVARLDPMKGHATLFQAFAQLFATRHNLRLVCVGDGPKAFRRFLEQLTRDLRIDSQLIWVTPGTAVEALYSAFDVFCLASDDGEGFPNVVAEAMSCGLPIVATDIGDSSTVIGDAGELAAFGAESLASSIGRVIDSPDLRRRHGCEGRERIKNMFSVEKLVQSTERVLLELHHEDE